MFKPIQYLIPRDHLWVQGLEPAMKDFLAGEVNHPHIVIDLRNEKRKDFFIEYAIAVLATAQHYPDAFPHILGKITFSFQTDEDPPHERFTSEVIAWLFRLAQAFPAWLFFVESEVVRNCMLHGDLLLSDQSPVQVDDNVEIIFPLIQNPAILHARLQASIELLCVFLEGIYSIGYEDVSGILRPYESVIRSVDPWRSQEIK